jgi:cytochrome c oxidase subunit 2
MERRQFMVTQAVALAAAATLPVLASRVIAQAAPAPRVIPVVVRKFVFIPGEITLRSGESVVLEFSAPEVAMGFSCAALGLRALIVPGQPARVPFTPPRAGRFDFACDVFCGDGHAGMQGQLLVT